jgi:hypothetical protein
MAIARKLVRDQRIEFGLEYENIPAKSGDVFSFSVYVRQWNCTKLQVRAFSIKKVGNNG